MNTPHYQQTFRDWINILIVDDHALFRQGLKRILESEPDFTVTGEASDGLEAIEMAGNLHPDVILMDVSMPNLNGIEATQKIKRMLPSTDIIILTMYDDPYLKEEGLQMGASGYFLKKQVDSELFDAIRKIRSGRPYSPNAVHSHNRLQKEPAPSARPLSYETLSQREKEVLRLLAGGMTNKEIAEHLSISINTAETHRKNAMKKLNLHNLSEIIKYAIVHRIIQR